MEEGKGHLNVLVFFFFKTCPFRKESNKSGGGGMLERDGMISGIS